MSSLRHTTEPLSDPRHAAYLDAARDCILDVGWRRTTLTEVAKRAGVSRMTLYRRWPDMPGLLGDLMLREWGALVAAEMQPDPAAPLGRHAIAAAVVRCTSAVRENALFRKIVEVEYSAEMGTLPVMHCTRREATPERSQHLRRLARPDADHDQH